MAGQQQTLRLEFTGGLDERDEASVVPQSFATALQNWEPDPSGSLRVTRGWQPSATAGLSGARVGRGIKKFVPSAGSRIVVGHAIDSVTYRLTRWPASNLPASTGSWTTIESVTVTDSTRPLAMAVGLGRILYCTPEFPSAHIRSWDGTTAADVSTDAIAGRDLCYLNNRFFSGGDLANPTYLRWSELGDLATWTVDVNFQPIGQEDGEPIESFCIFDRGLFIGKENSIWYQTGFGPDTFAWHQLDGGGVAPGRTLVPTPTGVCAVGRERVWMFSGGGFVPISRPIEISYGMTGNFMSGAYMDGQVFICDEGSGTIWVYDLESQVWSSLVPFTPAEMPCIVASEGDYLFGAAKNATANASHPLLLFKQLPGGSRVIDTGIAETFLARTGQMWLGDAMGPFTARYLYLQIRQRGGTSASVALTVNHICDGTTVANTVPLLDAGAGVFRARVDLSRTGYSHQFEFTQAVASGSTATVDIEQAILEGTTEGSR